jgi:hypothetical protein
MPFGENASRTESLNPGVGWPSVREIISRPSHPAFTPLPSRNFPRAHLKAGKPLSTRH